jgi:hypothetical protein
MTDRNLGRDPDAFEAFYRTHVQAVTGLSIGTVKLPRNVPPGVRSDQFYASSTFLITGQATACQYRPEPPMPTPILPPGTHVGNGAVVAESGGEFLFPNSIKPPMPSRK